MHPILFESEVVSLYTYGFFRALGAILGFAYIAWQGKKQFAVTIDSALSLFLLLVFAGIVGGKLFFFFENPSAALADPKGFLFGGGFVFYGTLLLGVPAMLWYFRRYHIPTWPMLDVMAIAICIVHVCGRIGCFMAGCCYGLPTDNFFAVTFTNPVCLADPLNTPLHPTQLYEAALIFTLLVLLWFLRHRRQFDGQLFLLYLIIYAIGRFIIEYYRGDTDRGFVIDGYLSTSQFISLCLALVACFFYVRRRNLTLVSLPKPRNNGASK